MRTARRILHLVVPAVGMTLVIGAVLFADSLPIQLFLVIAGLMLTEAGLWRLADSILPEERKYLALRAEADHFTTLVRQLNAAALALDESGSASSRFAMDEVRKEMHRSVDRMVAFAGKTKAEVGVERAGAGGGEGGHVAAEEADAGEEPAAVGPR